MAEDGDQKEGGKNKMLYIAALVAGIMLVLNGAMYSILFFRLVGGSSPSRGASQTGGFVDMARSPVFIE